MKKTVCGVVFQRDGYGADDCWRGWVDGRNLRVDQKSGEDGWGWSAWADEGPYSVGNGRTLCYSVDGSADTLEAAMRAAIRSFAEWRKDLREMAANEA